MNKVKINSNITVIIPFYNGRDFIKKALESLANEITKADQIIIINDGSTRNNDVLFLKRLIYEFPIPIKLVNKKNGGQSEARNLGAKLAKTKFISFLDQDDMVYPIKNKVLKKSLEEEIIKDPLCCYVYGDVTRINKNDTILEDRISSTRELKLKNKEDSFKFETKKYIYKDLYRLVGSALFVREKFLDSGGFDNNLVGYEDDDLFLNLHLSKYTFKKVNDQLLFWRLNRLSTSYTDTFKKSRFKYFKKLLGIFKNKDFEYTELILTRFMVRFTLDIFLPLFKLNFFKGNILKSIKVSILIFKKSISLMLKTLETSSERKSNNFLLFLRIYFFNKVLYFLKLTQLVLIK